MYVYMCSESDGNDGPSLIHNSRECFIFCPRSAGFATIILEVKKFLVKINHKQGWACKKYRNKAGMKKQEDYPTTVKS